MQCMPVTQLGFFCACRLLLTSSALTLTLNLLLLRVLIPGRIRHDRGESRPSQREGKLIDEELPFLDTPFSELNPNGLFPQPCWSPKDRTSTMPLVDDAAVATVILPQD